MIVGGQLGGVVRIQYPTFNHHADQEGRPLVACASMIPDWTGRWTHNLNPD